MNSKHISSPIRRLLGGLLIVFPVLLNAQSPKGELTLGSEISSEIKAGEVHRYSVNLEAKTFFFGVVNQRGVDLEVKTLDPSGEEIQVFDSPNGLNGDEPFTISAKTAGAYQVLVQPLYENPNPAPGSYMLKVERMEDLAQSPEGKVDQLFAAWDREGVPGASVAIAHKGEILYAKGYGEAQLEYNIPNSPTTVFHVASVSKQFTAFAIAYLADQDKIDLDADIRTYLPEMPDFGETITVRHLVHHTSGLRDQWNLLVMAGWRFDDVITEDQIMTLLKRQRELNFPPGEEFVYCNSGFTLMAKIVEKVTGQKFSEWCQEHVFEPLGMNSTQFYDDHERIVPNRSYSYYEAGGGYKKRVLSYANVGATSLFTTVEDLSKWAWNFEQITVGNQNLMKQMHERGILNSGDTISYAFGQFMGTYKGLKEVSHGGADAGYRTFLLRFPEEAYSIVVLSNLRSFNPGGLAYRVADIYLADKIEEDPPSSDSENSTSEEADDFDPSAVDLALYTGTYYSQELDTYYRLKVKEGKLQVSHLRRPDIILHPIGEDLFQGEAYFLRGTAFTRNEEGAIDGFKVSNGRVRNLRFSKVE